MSKQFKRLEYELDNGGAFIRIPDAGSVAADGDDMTIVVWGQKPSGQWMQVDAVISRSQVENFAAKLHAIIDLEEKKVAKMRRAMLHQ
jgi:hypothetical protein